MTLNQRLADFWARAGAPLSLVIVAAASLVHLYGLGQGDLYPWDECSYALRARYAMRGHWLDQMPYCYGYQGMSGFYSGAFPPLLIWLMAGSMQLLGITTFAARLPAALMGTAAVWGMYLWGRDGNDRTTGVWSAFILGSMFYFASYARRAQFDVPVTMFILFTVYLGMLYYRHGHLRWLILAGVAMGLGLMTKILVAGWAAVALLIFAGIMWLRGELKLKRIILDQVILNAIGVGLALPWHLFMLFKYRSPEGGLFKNNEFFEWFWGYHVVLRSQEAEGKHLGEWYYYITLAWERVEPFWTTMMIVAFFWALWMLIPWIVRGIRERRQNVEREDANPAWSDKHPLLLAMCWLLFVMSLSAMSVTKNKTYLVPMAPPLVFISARFLVWLWRERNERWVRCLAAFVAIFMLIASRSSDFYQELGMWVQWPPKVGKLLVLVGPVLIGAAIIVAILEGIARAKPHLQRLTMFFALFAVAAYGIHGGMRETIKGSDLKEEDENYWGIVEKEVRKDDFSHLIFFGNPDQPDHYFYLDGINAGWREGIEYTQVAPPAVEEIEPYPLKPDSLVVMQKFWGREAGWTEEDLDVIFENYELVAEDPEHYAVYRPPS